MSRGMESFPMRCAERTLRPYVRPWTYYRQFGSKAVGCAPRTRSRRKTDRAQQKSPTAGEGSDGAVHSETVPVCSTHTLQIKFYLRRRMRIPAAPIARSESEVGSGTTGVPNWPVALAEKSLIRVP